MSLKILPAKAPSSLTGLQNGKISNDKLTFIKGLQGSANLKLLPEVARGFKAMATAALADGIVLMATSLADSYRTYEIQVQIFTDRYTTKPLPGRPHRTWNDKTYYQKPGTAAAAVPGTSNHGKAMAIDFKMLAGVFLWLDKNALRFGFAWELPSENWHLHWIAGNNIPQAVLDYEKSLVNISEDDDMLEGYDKSPEDQARAIIRDLCDSKWGKGVMKENDQNYLLVEWQKRGREAMMTKLTDDTRNKG